MIGRNSVGDGLFGFMVISVTMAAAFSYVVIAGISKDQERKVEMSDNRIGAACWYSPNNKDWLPGTLRAWSTDHEEYDMGPGQVPVGVVEDDETGRCHSIYVERISFASAPPRGN